MFGFNKKANPPAGKGTVPKSSGVSADFGLAACQGCGGHTKGCSLNDNDLLGQLGFSPNHPQRSEILRDARKQLG